VVILASILSGKWISPRKTYSEDYQLGHRFSMQAPCV
jgi:hypothetical protein